MAHVTALAQHILSLEPDKDAARLCFYHFLKNLCDATEIVNSDLVNRFYSRALSFQHWQERKLALFQEVTAVLLHFQDTHRVQLPLHKVLNPEYLQVFMAENIRVMETAVGRYLERTCEPDEQFRIFAEGGERVVAIVLEEDRTLKVAVYPRVLAVRDGELVPLNQDFTLHYSPDLSMPLEKTQQLEIGPNVSARFRATAEGIFGSLVRGYTFQRYAVMDGGALPKHPVLFYPLKRLEQFFVYRKSDQMYVELTNILEKAMDLIAQKHPEAVKFAEAALERGRLALEHIYSDDKVIQLLINNLEKTLALESNRTPEWEVRVPMPALEARPAYRDEPPPGTFEIS